VRAGDTVRIAGQPFRMVAKIEAEPDRFAGTPGLGLWCILSRDG
jgi:hypothetical protein